MKAVVVLVALAVALAVPVEETAEWSAISETGLDASALKPERSLTGLESSDLLQVQLSDYPGCGMGYFWCQKFRESGISEIEASKISFQNDVTQPDEWFFDGRPTCVARGAPAKSCSEFSNVLFCAGGSTFGQAEEQTDALINAIRNNGTHLECSGCTKNRKIENSPTVCLTAIGEICEIKCENGFAQNGTLICDETHQMSGATCEPIPIDTEITELTEVSPSVSPTPSPPPEYSTTPAIFSHENWTKYDEDFEDREHSDYLVGLLGGACLYLLDLENHFHDIHYLPNKPLRAKLFETARLMDCGWVHEAEYALSAERKHVVPKRGDSGPWKQHTPIIHVLVNGTGLVSVALSEKNSEKNSEKILENSKNSQNSNFLENSRGSDLYESVSQVLGVKSDEFTLYLPGGVHPIDENKPLSTYNIQYRDILECSIGHKTHLLDSTVQEDSRTQNKTMMHNKLRSWKTGAVRDPQKGPIAP